MKFRFRGNPDKNTRGNIMPLAKLKIGQKVVVTRLNTKDRHRLQKIMAMGILPGKTITLLQKFPSYVFQAGHSQFAVDRELAEAIIVQDSEQGI
ncbi:MAG: FeoA family protein [Candidatus Omnitrophica bacterium]|nr:FeoA family protein [Candidatus Omnitrophota bacterium]